MSRLERRRLLRIDTGWSRFLKRVGEILRETGTICMVMRLF
ncbi:MAG: hypothetical protein ACOWYE_13775 [Desulfatiglandales bacterium]